MNILNVQELVSTGAAEAIAFYTIAVVAICLSVGVITDKNVVRAGFLLIGVFGGISGIFFLLQAQFIALAQVMIYAVGITLVVVIALMLTNPRLQNEADEEEAVAASEPPLLRLLTAIRSMFPGVVAWLGFVTIYLAIRSENWVKSDQTISSDNLAVIGKALTTDYSLPFEFASVLLLAALIGAIMLAKAEKVDTTDTPEGLESGSN